MLLTVSPSARAEKVSAMRCFRTGSASAITSATDGEICVCDITGDFEVSGPTISHHLRVLREAGLIEGERRGTWVYYRPVPANLKQIAALLQS